ncbi:hypothetical protein PRZ48_006226 [Zasmidium cellare]|uniref:Uncharacterized protein n=1 Tax=Zasmidium cellare TaxID=395010 RepID=A0ABR0ENR4_ZASCE|nr:hypothetical protein PRZ48_006226 [Zasmidium cellare]
MAAPFETSTNEVMKDGEARAPADETGKEAQLQLDSTASPRKIATKKNTRHKPSLLGLPAEIRVMIYDLLTFGDRNTDLDIFPMDCFVISPQDTSPDYPAYLEEVQPTQQTVKSWSWIHTCRTMFDEGRWNVIKTHIVSFRSEAQFDFADTHVVKTMFAFCFPGLHYSHHLAWHVGERIEKNVCLLVVRSREKDGRTRLRKPERSILVEVER